jgi:hypothetical protein
MILKKLIIYKNIKGLKCMWPLTSWCGELAHSGVHSLVSSASNVALHYPFPLRCAAYVCYAAQVFDEELQALEGLVRQLAAAGADAAIVQVRSCFGWCASC